jgi:hypothetical protein
MRQDRKTDSEKKDFIESLMLYDTNDRNEELKNK